MKQTLALALTLVLMVPISALFALKMIEMVDHRIDQIEHTNTRYMEGIHP